MTPNEALGQYWGYASFRTGQKEVIEAILDRRDVLAILPTGGGKSLCYQVPAMVLEQGFVMVVTPLVALMKDQVAQLSQRGISAGAMHSGLKHHEIDQMWTDAEFGRFNLLYVSPERLNSELFLARAARLPVKILAIDEAHCISEWGDHFRPAYLTLTEARARLHHPPMLAVTATATPIVRKEIKERLGLHEPYELVQGFDRPNLTWSVFRTDNKQEKVREILQNVNGCGILYAATRNHVEEWADWLHAQGFSTERYHGGMNYEARSTAQNRWVSGQTRLMVATNAFGMGIDKPDVRVVIHADMPATLESYYQEAGRAGRDGRRSYAVLLWHQKDGKIHDRLIEESYPTAQEVRKIYDGICHLGQVPLASLPEDPVLVRMEVLAKYVGLSALKIQNALAVLSRSKVLFTHAAMPFRGQLRIKQPIETLRMYAQKQENKKLGTFILTLLRTVNAEAFSGWYELDLRMMSRKMGLPLDRVEKGLQFLEVRELISWIPSDGALRLQFLEPRTQSVVLDEAQVSGAKKRAKIRLKHMQRYAQGIGCRRHFLLNYFGESTELRCGKCDICMGRHRVKAVTKKDELYLQIMLQRAEEGLPKEKWFEETTIIQDHLDGLLDWLMHEGYLRLKDPLRGFFEVTPKGLKILNKLNNKIA